MTKAILRRDWFEEVWQKWKINPEEVETKYGTHPFGKPSWTELFKGDHPEVMKTHPRFMEYIDKYKLKINMSVFPKQINNFMNVNLKEHDVFKMNYIIEDSRPYIVLMEDMLQNISFNAVGELMVKIYDSMEIGGEVVIKTPDLINMTKKYINNEIQYVDFIKILYGNQTESIDFYSCIYEPNAIKALLEDVGFSNITVEHTDDGLTMVVMGKKYKELNDK